MEEKKMAVLCTLRVLQMANEYEKLTQGKIAEIVSAMFPCNRKTVGRHLKMIDEAGYCIVHTREYGYHLESELSNKEKKTILDALYDYSEKYNVNTKDIKKKIIAL